MVRCTSFWSSTSKNGQVIDAFTVLSSKRWLRGGGPGPLITLKWAICSPINLASRDSRDKRPTNFRKLDFGLTCGNRGSGRRGDATAIYRRRRCERLQHRNSRPHDDPGRTGGQDNGEKRDDAFIAVVDRCHD